MEVQDIAVGDAVYRKASGGMIAAGGRCQKHLMEMLITQGGNVTYFRWSCRLMQVEM